MEDGEGKSQVVKEKDLATTAQSFWDFLNIHDEPQKADVIFILGGSSLAPVYRAAELYKQGLAPRIAFISQGGKFGGEVVWGTSEVEKYRAELSKLGIPEEAIVYQEESERQTRNTLAEAQAAIPFLEERGIKPQRIILTARPIHQRRAWSTFQEQYPDIQYINCPADEPLNLANPEDVTRLVQEAERLLDYGVKKNDIKRPDISVSLLRDAATVRRFLKSTKQYEPRIKPET